MNVPPLATLLSTFFLRYLAVERGVSPHTSTSYRDAMKLLLQFSATRCRRSVDQLVIEDLKAPVVLDFLRLWKPVAPTRSARAMRDWPPYKHFFRYIAGQEPSLAALCSPVLGDSGEKSPPPCTGLSERAGTRSPAGAGRSLWPSTENVITCSSACSMTPALVFKNCLT